MGDTKHTPGPWAVDDHDYGVEVFRAQPMPGGGRGEGICAVYGWGAMRDADARLIAAAPELLEALERVVKLDAHGCLTRDCPHKTGRECAEELATVLAEMIDRARYAIEKARGEG